MTDESDFVAGQQGVAMDMQWMLAENITTGALIGLTVGVLARFAVKAVQILLLIQFILLKWLEARNIIMVDWERLSMGLVEAQEIVVGQANSLVETLTEMGLFGASLAVGFFVGQKVAK